MKKKLIIDVSEHNGVVDLNKARDQIAGLIARCSWGWGDNQIDKQWKNNAEQANKYGIPLYAYHFCYARNREEALKEAELAISACHKYKVNVIYYDMEFSSFQGELTNNELYEIANTFCNRIEESGYAVGIYANENWFKNKLTHEGFKQWTLWLANYGINDGFDHWNGSLAYNPFGNVLLHQFTSNAKEGILKDISGIESKGLDCNLDYGLLDTFNKYALQNESHGNIMYSVGDKVSFERLYYSSSGDEYTEKILFKTGIITNIIEGSKNPYLINNGMGWINNEYIK